MNADVERIVRARPFPVVAEDDPLVQAIAAHDAGAETEESSPSIIQTPWPTLDPVALHGLAGEMVRTLEPHTESDPVALLLQFHVAFGSVLGRGPHFRVEADRHGLNLFGCVVGDTSKARKGTSWGHIRRVFADIDPEWSGGRILSGLSSGEGVVWAVRDAIFKTEAVRESGKPTGETNTVLVDPGVTDKRLLVVETEFANAFHVMGRDGSTLSPIIRQAWDTGSLRVMTKNNPVMATDAHIAILGHIVRDELLRLLDTTEAANGFCNRFLWACAHRSKTLPDGGCLTDAEMIPVRERVRRAVEFARQAGTLTRNEAAGKVWHAVYPALSEGRPGLLGAVTSRAEAQVMRLACLYALEDMSYVVRQDHLLAALALWQYLEDSARFIFGERLGDPVADELLTALRSAPHGMTRTEVRDWFGRNRKTHEIDRALGVLLRQRLVRREVESLAAGVGGRPTERWFATLGATTLTTLTTKPAG